MTLFRMEISLDFTDPSDRPKRRGPPPRFAAMAKPKESAPPVEQVNKADVPASMTKKTNLKCRILCHP